MDITVSSRHADVSPALRQAVAEKIGRLDRFLDGMDRAEIHFSEERNPRISAREVCEVTLEGHGHHVRAKVAAPDQFAAVDVAVGEARASAVTAEDQARSAQSRRQGRR